MLTPSLRSLATKVAIRHVNQLQDVGDLPYELVKPILRKVPTADLLHDIELGSPQIVGHDGEIWIALCKRDILGYDKLEDDKEPIDPADWYKVYNKLRREAKAIEEAERQKVHASLQALRDEKKSRQIKRVELKGQKEHEELIDPNAPVIELSRSSRFYDNPTLLNLDPKIVREEQELGLRNTTKSIRAHLKDNGKKAKPSNLMSTLRKGLDTRRFQTNISLTSGNIAPIRRPVAQASISVHSKPRTSSSNLGPSSSIRHSSLTHLPPIGFRGSGTKVSNQDLQSVTQKQKREDADEQPRARPVKQVKPATTFSSALASVGSSTALLIPAASSATPSVHSKAQKRKLDDTHGTSSADPQAKRPKPTANASSSATASKPATVSAASFSPSQARKRKLDDANEPFAVESQIKRSRSITHLEQPSASIAITAPKKLMTLTQKIAAAGAAAAAKDKSSKAAAAPNPSKNTEFIADADDDVPMRLPGKRPSSSQILRSSEESGSASKPSSAASTPAPPNAKRRQTSFSDDPKRRPSVLQRSTDPTNRRTSLSNASSAASSPLLTPLSRSSRSPSFAPEDQRFIRIRRRPNDESAMVQRKPKGRRPS